MRGRSDYMRDYEYLISIALRDKLKESIKGRVFCKVEYDYLYISIQTRELDRFEYKVYDFADKLITGRLIVDEIAATVVANYKKYILAYFTYSAVTSSLFLNCTYPQLRLFHHKWFSTGRPIPPYSPNTFTRFGSNRNISGAG